MIVKVLPVIIDHVRITKGDDIFIRVRVILFTEGVDRETYDPNRRP